MVYRSIDKIPTLNPGELIELSRDNIHDSVHLTTEGKAHCYRILDLAERLGFGLLINTRFAMLYFRRGDELFSKGINIGSSETLPAIIHALEFMCVFLDAPTAEDRFAQLEKRVTKLEEQDTLQEQDEESPTGGSLTIRNGARSVNLTFHSKEDLLQKGIDLDSLEEVERPSSNKPDDTLLPYLDWILSVAEHFGLSLWRSSTGNLLLSVGDTMFTYALTAQQIEQLAALSRKN